MHDIDLTRVETRPSRSGTWNYVFFIDFEGHQDDPVVHKVLERLSDRVNELHVAWLIPQRCALKSDNEITGGVML